MSKWNNEASQTIAEQPGQAVSPAGLPEHLGGVSRPETERRQVAWVGKSVVLKGELISSEDMTIDGRVEGIIEVRDHTLTIGADARIHADIAARTVVVLGYIEGAVTASEKVVIGRNAVVEGNVVAASLTVADGAILRGRVETTAKAGKKPAKPAVKEVERELVSA